MFYALAVLAGILAGVADAVLNHWALGRGNLWYVVSAALYLAWMTLFGILFRIGATQGYPFTIAVVIVLMVNIAIVALWDAARLGTMLSPLQWAGAALCVLGAVCFELARG